jgi:uracil-DNA glycosylase
MGARPTEWGRLRSVSSRQASVFKKPALLGGKFTKLPEMRSRWHEFAEIPVMVTYHPDNVLQSASAKAKRATW